MTEAEALDVLRRARPDLPDHVASPTSAAAQALLEEILYMPTPVTDRPPADPAPDPVRRPHRRPRARRALVAAASAAAFVTAAAVAVTVGGGDPDGGETVEVGPATGPGQPTAGRSGRLQVTWRLDWDVVTDPIETVTSYEFSGDDLRWEMAAAGAEYREVDGIAWTRMSDAERMAEEVARSLGEPGAELPASAAWQEVDPSGPRPHDLDPATLFDTLAASTTFDVVGEEEVGGVPTERQRATAPDLVALEDLHLEPYFPGPPLSGLETWLDGDGLVRLDVTRTGVEQGEPWTETWSLVWSDLGQPITIEPPDLGDDGADTATGDDQGTSEEEQAALEALEALLQRVRDSLAAAEEEQDGSDAQADLDAARQALEEAQVVAEDEQAQAAAGAELQTLREELDRARAELAAAAERAEAQAEAESVAVAESEAGG